MTVTRSRIQRGGSDGFGVVELLIATAVLAFALIAFAAILGAALRESTTSSVRTEARLAASNHIEKLRTMEYDDLGIVGGNPGGTVQPTVVDGRFTLKTKITYQNDPVPGQPFNSYRDYKVVRVDVSETRTGKVWSSPETKIAPPGRPGANEGVVKSVVMDDDNNLMPDVAVRITGGPKAEDRTDTTSEAGEVIFAGLAPAPESQSTRYTLSVSVPGYRVDPSSTTQFALAASSTQTPLIRLIRDYKVRVDLKRTSGSAYTFPTGTNGCTTTLNAWAGNLGDNVKVSAAISTNPFESGSLGSTYFAPGDYTFAASCIPNSSLSSGNPRSGRKAWFSSWSEITLSKDDPLGTVVPAELRMEDFAFANVAFTAKKGSTPLKNATIIVKGGPANTLTITTTDSSGAAVKVYLPQSPSSSSNDYELTVINSNGDVVATTSTSVYGLTPSYVVTVP